MRSTKGGGAEQQAVLVGHPVVVDDRADVAAADRADPLDQFVRQRLGHHLERVGIDGGAVQLGFEPVEEAVAGPEQLVRGDRALGRAHADALAVLHLQRRAVFEYPCAEAGQRLASPSSRLSECTWPPPMCSRALP